MGSLGLGTERKGIPLTEIFAMLAYHSAKTRPEGTIWEADVSEFLIRQNVD